jgi:nitroimidazol reductase NimA-like FMN-containing flavoprotein (pyridoxamine 5'-phosphate oxidase superfamily)
MIVWGLWLDGTFYFSTGNQSRKAKNLANNPKCVICTEHAEQAVLVEGTATPTTEPAILKRFGALYQKKYKWDMSGFAESVYVVRPRVAFGLYEKDFMGSATRWRFER